jgi:hypothetical protein
LGSQERQREAGTHSKPSLVSPEGRYGKRCSGERIEAGYLGGQELSGRRPAAPLPDPGLSAHCVTGQLSRETGVEASKVTLFEKADG